MTDWFLCTYDIAFTISGLFLLRRPTAISSNRSLDKTFLLRISIITCLSAAGCLIIAIVKLSWRQTYSWVLDLYLILNPLIASATLVDRDCFRIWLRWLKLDWMIESWAAYRRDRRLVILLTQKSRSQNARAQWTPPRPSCSRPHRPTSASTAGGYDFSDSSSYNESIECAPATRRLSEMVGHQLAMARAYLSNSRKSSVSTTRFGQCSGQGVQRVVSNPTPVLRGRSTHVGGVMDPRPMSLSLESEVLLHGTPKTVEQETNLRRPKTANEGTPRVVQLSSSAPANYIFVLTESV